MVRPFSLTLLIAVFAAASFAENLELNKTIAPSCAYKVDTTKFKRDTSDYSAGDSSYSPRLKNNQPITAYWFMVDPAYTDTGTIRFLLSDQTLDTTVSFPAHVREEEKYAMALNFRKIFKNGTTIPWRYIWWGPFLRSGRE